MKKLLLFLCFFLDLQARLYLGITAGYATQSEKSTGITQNGFAITAYDLDSVNAAFQRQEKNYTLGIIFGTEQIVANVFGTRWGISLGYASIGQTINQEFLIRDYLNLGLNFDLMLDFYNDGLYSVGIFGGAELEYSFCFSNNPLSIGLSSPHLFYLHARTGVSVLLEKHHRLEFVAKLPFFSLSAIRQGKNLLGGSSVPGRTSLMTSYKFVF